MFAVYLRVVGSVQFALGMFKEHALWVTLMGLIQAINLGVGIVYTITGVLHSQLSAFPMFNAAWIGVTRVMWYLRHDPVSASRA